MSGAFRPRPVPPPRGKLETNLESLTPRLPVPITPPPLIASREKPDAPVHAVLAFGANLGDRESAILGAYERLEATAGISVVALSNRVDSVAVKPGGPDPDAPGYLNAVAQIETTLSPRELLTVTSGIETEFGRERHERWGDRTLDIDIITYGDLAVSESDLSIPHPRAHERDFVLEPWWQLDPAATLPGHGPIAILLNRATDRPAGTR